MRRLFKILFYLVLLVVFVAGAGVAAFVFTPSATLAGYVEEQVEAETGRKLTIGGEIERSVFPTLGVKVTDVTFANADWATSGPLFTAESAEIAVRTLSLLTGGLEIERIAVAKPQIQVEIDESGRRSYELNDGSGWSGGGRSAGQGGGGAGGPRGGDDMAIGLLVQEISVTDGALRILDRSQGGRRTEVAEIALNGSFASLEDDFNLTGSAIAQGRPAKLEVKLASPAALARGEQAALVAKFDADGVTAVVDGTLRAPTDSAAPEAKGEMTLALDGDKQRTAWLRALLPAELEPLEAVAMNGAYNLAEDGLDVQLEGQFGFNGQPTTLSASAQAGDGWADGAQPVLTDLNVANALMSGAFKGTVQQAETGPPTVQGDYRLKVSDAQALMRWTGAPPAAPDDPASRLESVDVAGGVEMTGEALAAALKGDLGYNARSIVLDAGVRGGRDWDEGGALETNVSASAPRLFTASWKGVVAQEGAAVKGDASFSSKTLRAFFEWIGLGPIDAPQGSFEQVSFKSDVDVGPEAGALKNFDVTIDKSRVQGEMSYDLSGERPAVTATLNSGPLDIRPFTQTAAQGGQGAGGGGGGGGGASDKWSREPLDLSALQLVDAEIEVRTEGLATNVAKLDKTHVTASLKNGRLETVVKEMALYGGQAVGVATIDGSSATPAMALDLDVTGVNLRPLLNDAAQMDWLEGTGAVKADIAGSGVSQYALMKSLAGSASIDFRDGAIIGYNLAAIVRNVTTLGQGGDDQQKTDFAEMTASFQIANGVAQNDDFFMSGPLVRLTGAGSIDIGEQTLNYRAVPKAVATLEGQGGDKGLSGIAFPVLITGPWSNPSVTPDLAGGALESVEGLLADPEGAGAFLNQLTGGGEGGGGLGDVLDSVTGGGGGGGEGSEGGGGLGDVLRGVTGGDDKKKNPLGGLF